MFKLERVKMNLRSTALLAFAAILLAGCSFTLAADITPPPDYVSPTPLPTLGPAYPASPPSIETGAAIFAEKCMPCHGRAGLGDGPQSMQLPVTVPGIGLADVARAASPADWFKIVSQGNLDRFMPPFAGSLTDQQRWDVVAYALTLHVPASQAARGQSLIQRGCANCPAAFSDQEKMAALSEKDLVAMLSNGSGSQPAFGKDLSDDDAYAVAAYLRSLTFSAAPKVAAAATPSAAQGSPENSTPAAASTATPSAGIGEVTGSIEFPSGGKPTNLTVTLHGFDHATDQTSGPQEVLTLSAPASADGSFAFENVGMPVNRIFLAEVNYAGITYRSDFAAASADSVKVALSPLKVYKASTDVSLLKLDQVHISTDFSTAGTVQVLEIFALKNASNNAVVISTDGTTIPFIPFPEGATDQGYEAGQGSAPFVKADQGLAVVPSDKPYSIIAFFNLPYEKKADINQPLAIDMPSLILLVPQGIKVQGKQLESRGLQVIEKNNYEEFSASGLKAGQTLAFSVSGQPKASTSAGIAAHQGWLIGGAALGMALIGGGLFLYVRERRRQPAAPDEADFESADEVLDAILALDDLHQAGKISDEAYQVRRNELKETLKDLS
jgi:mono/diheme cytochrome c family protein